MFPWDGLSLGQAFKKILYRHGIVRHQPLFNKRMQQLTPIVLRRRIVVYAGQHGDQVAGKSPGWDGRCNDHHAVDCNKLRTLKRPSPATKAHEGVNQRDKNEKEEDCAGRDIVRRHARRGHGQARIGKEDVNDKGKERTYEERTQRYFSCHDLASYEVMCNAARTAQTPIFRLRTRLFHAIYGEDNSSTSLEYKSAMRYLAVA